MGYVDCFIPKRKHVEDTFHKMIFQVGMGLSDFTQFLPLSFVCILTGPGLHTNIITELLNKKMMCGPGPVHQYMA